MSNTELLDLAMESAGFTKTKSRNKKYRRFLRGEGAMQQVADLAIEWRRDAFRAVGAIGIIGLPGDLDLISTAPRGELTIPLENYPNISDVSIMDEVTYEKISVFIKDLIKVMDLELPTTFEDFYSTLSGGGGKFGEYVRIMDRLKHGDRSFQ